MISLRTVVRLVAGACLGVALSVTPVSAEASPLVSQCLIPPGVYGIIDAEGDLVGLLIVYPDCRMEVYKPQEPI